VSDKLLAEERKKNNNKNNKKRSKHTMSPKKMAIVAMEMAKMQKN
jgi:hypothetical protein